MSNVRLLINLYLYNLISTLVNKRFVFESLILAQNKRWRRA